MKMVIGKLKTIFFFNCNHIGTLTFPITSAKVLLNFVALKIRISTRTACMQLPVALAACVDIFFKFHQGKFFHYSYKELVLHIGICKVHFMHQIFTPQWVPPK